MYSPQQILLILTSDYPVHPRNGEMNLPSCFCFCFFKPRSGGKGEKVSVLWKTRDKETTLEDFQDPQTLVSPSFFPQFFSSFLFTSEQQKTKTEKRVTSRDPRLWNGHPLAKDVHKYTPVGNKMIRESEDHVIKIEPLLFTEKRRVRSLLEIDPKLKWDGVGVMEDKELKIEDVIPILSHFLKHEHKPDFWWQTKWHVRVIRGSS